MNSKERFIELLQSVKREGAQIEKLISKLEESGFFTAPASTKYHSSFEGGLCQHSLNVYDNLSLLCKSRDIQVGEDSLIICSLLHDMSKMNMYEEYVKNAKVYKPTGGKVDEIGRFDWEAQKAYKIKEAADRFVYGNHEQTSLFMISRYIPLTLEEEVAILHHMGGVGEDSNRSVQISEVFNRYTFALMLHLADMMATFIDERID